MTPSKLAGVRVKIFELGTFSKFAKQAGVDRRDVSNFFNKKRFISKNNKKKIKQTLIEMGLLSKPKPIEYVMCELGFKHRKKTEHLPEQHNH